MSLMWLGLLREPVLSPLARSIAWTLASLNGSQFRLGVLRGLLRLVPLGGGVFSLWALDAALPSLGTKGQDLTL